MKFLRTITLIVSVVFAAGVSTQELGDVAFRQALRDLTTDLRLMCVAAHPDDEDGATLAYYRMLHGVETHAVIATRGEGGQNEIGPELYNELGVIRTREMGAAAQVEGAILHFLNLPEFGYSKTPEETTEVWGENVALERLVRVIRETRPHVIITNHGRLIDHGHHQAIGAAVQAAFSAAADETQFPEQIQAGLAPWQPGGLYVRDFRGGEGAIANDIAILEPLRGKTIAEIAAGALEVHESQGMRFFIDLLLSTQPKTYYHLVKNTPRGKSKSVTNMRGPLFTGLDWEESEERPDIDPVQASRKIALAALLPWLKENEGFRTGSFDEQRRWETANRAAALAADLRLQVEPSDLVVTPGQTIKIQSRLRDFQNRDAIEAELTLKEIHGLGELGSHKIHAPMHLTGQADGEFSITIPSTATHTLPLAPRLFLPEFLEPQLLISAAVNCGDATIYLSAPVYLDVATPISIDSPDAPYLIQSVDTSSRAVRLLVTNNTNGALAEYVSLSVPEGWAVSPERQSVSLEREGEQRFIPFTVSPPEDVQPGDFEVLAQVAGLPAGHSIALRVVDLAVPPGVNVGVIQSYDDTFVQTLKKMGVRHETLSIGDYIPERLDSFSAIIVDIRAYQYRPDLASNNATLLDYVARGGTLLVMYQKNFDWRPDFAPFPITLSRNRVTREDAPVTVLVPDHPLFNTPNIIRESDWGGWIQERGLYFPDEWNEVYTPLVSVTDPDEEIPPGSYLVANHGKGFYVYTALGWYRQLRELHPGALRCFANMLALQREDQ